MHVIVKHASLCLGCLQATPLISEAALVNPDFTVAPSLNLWQTFLTTTGIRLVHSLSHITFICINMHTTTKKKDQCMELPEVPIVHHFCHTQSIPQPPGQAQGCSGTVGEAKIKVNNFKTQFLRWQLHHNSSAFGMQNLERRCRSWKEDETVALIQKNI